MHALTGYGMPTKYIILYKATRHSCLLDDKIINSMLMQGTRTTKSPKYIILLHNISIQMLHLTFECCNIRRFIRM